MKLTLHFRSIATLVVLSLITQELAFAIGSTPATNTVVPLTAKYDDSIAIAVAKSTQDPLIESLTTDIGLPDTIDLNPHDPIVDEDPYFIRSESWSNQAYASSKESAITVATQPGQVLIRMPDQKSTLTIRQDLVPFFQTSEFIFFAGGPSIFTAEKKNGQGVFFISVQQLYAGGKVPVFFYPLPGRNWIADSATSAVPSIVHEIPNHDLIIARETDGHLTPIALSDVRTIQRVESFNYNSAMVMALEKRLDQIQTHPAQYQAQIDAIRTETIASLKDLVARSRLPNNGMQMDRYASEVGQEAFKIADRFESHGLMQDIFPARGSTLGFGSFLTGVDWDNQNLSPIFKLKSQGWFSRLKNEMSSVAQADPLHDMIQHAIPVGIICGSAIFASVVLRATAFRNRVNAAIAAGDESIGKNNRQAIMTITTQSMNFIAQVPGIWTANFLEYILDAAGTSEHSIVRKTFDKTFGFLRNTSAQIRINHSSIIKGIVALGGSDIVVTALIQYKLIPPLLTHMAILFPSLHGQIQATAVALGAYALFSTVNNIVTWLQVGPTNYASQQSSMAQQSAITKVTSQMKDEGLDPTDPKNKEQFNKRVDQSVELEMANVGLPGKEAFLFNAAFVYNKILELIGYVNPDQTNKLNYAVSRSGKMLATLTATRDDLKKSGDLQAASVVESALNDFSLLRAAFKNPGSFTTVAGLKSILSRYRSVRTEISYFSISGEVGDIDKIPDSWMARGEQDSAVRAAHAFRTTLFKRMELIAADGAPAEIVAPSSSFNDPYAAAKTLGEQEVGFAKIEADFERWQLRHAEAAADAAFLETTGQSPDGIFNSVTDPVLRANAIQLQQQWSLLFKKSLLKGIGMSVPDFQDKTIAEVQTRVDTEFDRQAQGDAALQAYLSKLGTYERIRLVETLKADKFAELYVTMVRGEGLAPALSPLQPGRFQWLRQTKLVRAGGKPAAIALRLAEGFYPTSRFQRGFFNMLNRTIPMLDFQISANVRNLRGVVYAGTVGYWVAKAWRMAMPYQKFMLADLLGGPLISAEWTMTNEMTGNLGFKPGKSMPAMIAYGVIGSLTTWTEGLLFPLFADDTIRKFDSLIHAGVASVHPILQSCSQLFHF